MKEFIKNHFPGVIQFVRDIQTLFAYRKKKKEITEQKTNYESPAGSAGKLPASRLKRPSRKDFENDIEFEKAFYAWNTALRAPISS